MYLEVTLFILSRKDYLSLAFIQRVVFIHRVAFNTGLTVYVYGLPLLVLPVVLL